MVTVLKRAARFFVPKSRELYTVNARHITKVNSAGSFGGTYVVEAEIGNVGSRRIMYRSSHGEFAVGDILSDRVIFTEPEEKYRGYYLSDGILGACESLSDSVPTRLGEETGVKVTLSRIRSTLSSAFKSTMSRDSGGFASATSTFIGQNSVYAMLKPSGQVI